MKRQNDSDIRNIDTKNGRYLSHNDNVLLGMEAHRAIILNRVVAK